MLILEITYIRSMFSKYESVVIFLIIFSLTWLLAASSWGVNRVSDSTLVLWFEVIAACDLDLFVLDLDLLLLVLEVDLWPRLCLLRLRDDEDDPPFGLEANPLEVSVVLCDALLLLQGDPVMHNCAFEKKCDTPIQFFS